MATSRRRLLRIVVVTIGVFLGLLLIAGVLFATVLNPFRDDVVNRSDLRALRKDPMATWTPERVRRPERDDHSDTHYSWKGVFRPAEIRRTFPAASAAEASRLFTEAGQAARTTGWEPAPDRLPGPSRESFARPAADPTCSGCELTITIFDPAEFSSTDPDRPPSVWVTLTWPRVR